MTTTTTVVVSPPKAHLSLADQLALLKSRGMVVGDDAEATKTLRKISYYRLSGYWYPFRNTNPVGVLGRQDNFKPGTSLDLIEAIYEFDRQLRLLILKAVERIEVSLRSDIAHYLGKRNVYAHDCPSELDGNFTNKRDKVTGNTSFDDWQDKLQKAVSRASEEFVDHHRIKYGGKMPIWVVTELWDFGQLSKFYEGMRFSDKTNIAKKFCSSLDAPSLVSWLKTVSLVRNVSAHHARLWNRNITAIPSISPTTQINFLQHLSNDSHARTRVYGALCILQLLLKWIAPSDDWHTELIGLANTFPTNSVVSLKDAGFPDDWKSKSLWR